MKKNLGFSVKRISYSLYKSEVKKIAPDKEKITLSYHFPKHLGAGKYFVTKIFDLHDEELFLGGLNEHAGRVEYLRDILDEKIMESLIREIK